MASVWEMAIKIRLGKLRLSTPLERFIPDHLSANRFSRLEIDFRHLPPLTRLPFHHRDPFDRLLVAQCLEEKMPILSSDPIFQQYGVQTIW
ncbi:MAG: type II toxin-antitoxin system VapC family toxin [Nitrospirae bacterium]|nr:type II toxin-antitoxin system VapC family toxin [Nitrospirota bacterium]